jgi:hypothetical protein
MVAAAAALTVQEFILSRATIPPGSSAWSPSSAAKRLSCLREPYWAREQAMSPSWVPHEAGAGAGIPDVLRCGGGVPGCGGDGCGCGGAGTTMG